MMSYPKQVKRRYFHPVSWRYIPLPAVVAPLKYSIQGGHISTQHPAGEIHIELRQAMARRIGALVIPRMQVEFSFTDLDEDQRKSFMLPFRRSYGAPVV